MGRTRLINKVEPTDTYKTIFMGDNKDKEPILLTGDALMKLNRFKPIGWGQNTKIIFRGDGTVEVYGMEEYTK